MHTNYIICICQHTIDILNPVNELLRGDIIDRTAGNLREWVHKRWSIKLSNKRSYWKQYLIIQLCKYYVMKLTHYLNDIVYKIFVNFVICERIIICILIDFTKKRYLQFNFCSFSRYFSHTYWTLQAVSVASAISDRVCIHSNGTRQTEISSKNLMACDQNVADGCEGGVPFYAWLYWRSDGLVSGGPYGSKVVSNS